MDTDQSNSSGSSDQVDEMMLMMNMQSLSYSDNKNNFLDFSTLDYNGASSSSRFMHNEIPNVTTPSYPSPSDSISANFVPIPVQPSPGVELSDKKNSVAAMREMIFRMAVMQPIHIDPEAIKPPKRRNVKISKDPQSVAARHRRERISERIRILQRLVPGGTKMDTASMLDEAIHYVKFLKKQVQVLENPAMMNQNGISSSNSSGSNHGETIITGGRSIIGYPMMSGDMRGFMGRLRNDDV